jgi:hypothetical protein
MSNTETVGPENGSIRSPKTVELVEPLLEKETFS